ncbi:class I SAM-dependent methyltransferase [Desulfotalea psychrophila]|uniref:Methyltransferase domain-containing protein n=1 Tax=Desulfotalea psychrophila (strain LSv54 / DSM 12343) TaxID=177439 RepID=Q6AJI9_DESPS|nr:class I SAM-dependent methyltransferase [Desulfotalea psychrophila]CAG37491.1 hypothetical protein DP2762 [Desulfotalea psychrophila LSv54]
MKPTNTEITIEAYDINASKYANKFMEFIPYQEKIKLFQENFLTENSSILDLGCGPGNNANFLLKADRGYQIEGVDLSAQMIELAKKNAPDTNFRVQDIRTITSDKMYNAIIASFCIVHLADQETSSLIEKIAKMLKENGHLYLSFMEGKVAGLESTSFSKEDIFFNYYERSELVKLLARNDLETVEILDDDYKEGDGSTTKDVFIFARKC